MLGDTGALRNKPKGVRPKHLLSKVDVLARSVLPSLSKEDRGRILRVRAGFERAARNRPSLLMHCNNLDKCAGALNRDDLEDAKTDQREELDGAKLLAQDGLIWLLGMTYNTPEEHADTTRTL